MSRFYEAEHRLRGVDVRLGCTVDCVEESDGRATGVRLANSEVVPADIVIVGIGIVPEIEALGNAGARVANGVVVDSMCRTSLPDIFAIGDCTQHANAFAGNRPVRLESVQNATDQASTVAKVLAGEPIAYEAMPWFWSDQYDLRLQTIGLNSGYDDVIVRGDPGRKSFSVIYLRDRVVVAVDCVNSPSDFVQGKALILRRCRPERAQLQDTAVPLKSLAG